MVQTQMRNTVVTPMFRYSFCCLRHGEVTFKQMLQFQNWEGRMNDKPVTHEVKTSSRQPESDAVLGHSWVARGLLQCPSLRIKHTLHCCSYTNPSFLPLPGRRKALPLWRGVVSRSMPGGLQLIWLWKPSRHTDRAEEGQQDRLRAKPEPLQNTEPFRQQPARCLGAGLRRTVQKQPFYQGKKKKT